MKDTLLLLTVLATCLLIVSMRDSASPVSLARDGEKFTQNAASGFVVERIDEGVFSAIRREPTGLAFDANVVFIINDEDVVVVDTNVTPSSAREVLGALRKLTSKPVKYVINTHWHDDHIIGNSVYKEAFPGVEFIGHARTREDLPTVGAENRRQTIAGAPQLIGQLRQLVERGKNFFGAPLSAEERVSYLSDIAWGDRYLAEASSFQVILPTITVEDHLTLHRGNRVIEIMYLGRSHTRADLVVYLPKERIAVTGDIVVWPVPLVGSTSYPLDYGATLERLVALRASTWIPGHGQVLHDDAYLRLMVRLLDSIKTQVTAAVGRGENLEQVRKSINLTEFSAAFSGESPVRRFVFANYVTGPAVTAAFRQATNVK